MGKKYFCWNIDDGLEQDKKIIEELKRCGMGATFNLNSGLFGAKGMIGRMGDYGMKDVPLAQFKKGFHFLKYHESFRIPEDEVRQVYQGFEIASHGWCHENLKKVSASEASESVGKDVANLEKLFGTKIRGFAYPYGAFGEQTDAVLRENGICYARTIGKADSFDRPADLLHMSMTGWHIDKDIMQKLDRFVSAKAEGKDLFFLMFAHGYEFDFGTKESNWEKFRRICDKMAGREDILCCSTAEALGL